MKIVSRALASALTCVISFIAPAAAYAQQFSGLDHEPMSIANLMRARAANVAPPAPGGPSDPNSPDNLVQTAQSLVQMGQFDIASSDFRRAADLYAAIGQPDSAASAEMQAFHYESRLQLFYHRPTNLASVECYDTHRRLEPIYGCYIGAGIETEKSLPVTQDATTRHYRDCVTFNKTVGKKHAMFLEYMRYPAPFPGGFIATCKAAGAAAILAVEPDSLDVVQDDDVLASFVQNVKQAGVPVFVRFASEMNGEWTTYHKDPELYKQKFRLVAAAIHRSCPNAAMVWCSNDIPEYQISRYYPGQDAVDWVGVDFYCTYFRDNNPKDAIPWRNPADKLDYVYRTYSAVHPIMIGETGMAYQQSCDNVVRDDYAKSKLAELYQALPRRYPRVKAVVYLSMNAIHDSLNPHRRLNNYSLMDNTAVRGYYASMVAPHYYLSSVDLDRRDLSPTEYVPIAEGCSVSGIVPISAYIKTYSDHPVVTLELNSQVMDSRVGYDSHVWQIDTTKLANGPYSLRVSVSVKNQVVGESAVAFGVNNAGQAATAKAVNPQKPSQSP